MQAHLDSRESALNLIMRDQIYTKRDQICKLKSGPQGAFREPTFNQTNDFQYNQN